MSDSAHLANVFNNLVGLIFIKECLESRILNLPPSWFAGWRVLTPEPRPRTLIGRSHIDNHFAFSLHSGFVWISEMAKRREGKSERRGIPFPVSATSSSLPGVLASCLWLFCFLGVCFCFQFVLHRSNFGVVLQGSRSTVYGLLSAGFLVIGREKQKKNGCC